MSPKAFAAALRDFAAAVALSPDPAKSVADLALLIAQSVDENLAKYELSQSGPVEHDELAFPPVDKDELTDAQVSDHMAAERAREASGMSLDEWAGLEEVERGQRIAQHTAAA